MQQLNIYLKNGKKNFKTTEYKKGHFKTEVIINDEATKDQAQELVNYLIKQAEKITYKIKQYNKELEN